MKYLILSRHFEVVKWVGVNHVIVNLPIIASAILIWPSLSHVFEHLVSLFSFDNPQAVS